MNNTFFNMGKCLKLIEQSLKPKLDKKKITQLSLDGVLAQEVERPLCMQEVPGSILVFSKRIISLISSQIFFQQLIKT